jgi:hypothetical protein
MYGLGGQPGRLIDRLVFDQGIDADGAVGLGR